VPADSAMEINALQNEFKVNIEDRSSILEMFKKIFFLMDNDKDGMISKSEAQKGISYLDLEGILVAPSQKLVSSIFDQCINKRDRRYDNIDLSTTNQLRLSDFIRLLLTINVIGNCDTQTRKTVQK
jgi:Ca2+-binding EF-hand superfamily protein